MQNKVGLSCAKLSTAYASYPLAGIRLASYQLGPRYPLDELGLTFELFPGVGGIEIKATQPSWGWNLG